MIRNWQSIVVTAVVVASFWLVPSWALAQMNANQGTTGEAATDSQLTGSERFLRENRDPGQLVGGSVQGGGNLRGQTDTGGQSSGGMFGGQSGRFNTMNQFGNMFNSASRFNTMSRQRQQLRVPLRLGPNGVSFSDSETTPVVATGPNLRIQNRLTRIPQLKNPSALTVEMEGRIAVLRGDVSSSHERNLVARLVLLEPGIADVRNELQVAAPPAAPPPQTP